MEKIKKLGLKLVCILILCTLLYWIIGLLSFSLSEKPLIKYDGAVNGTTIRIEEAIGGATSSDYLIIYINDSITVREKIADPINVERIVNHNDSLFLVFVDSVYFINDGVWRKSLPL